MKQVLLLIGLMLCSANRTAAQYAEDSNSSLRDPSTDKEMSAIEQKEPPASPGLFGGIHFNALLKNDGWYVLRGGKGNAAGHIFNTDILISADMSRILPVDELQLFCHILGNNGGSISTSVGDLQMISNIEGYRTLKVYQWWLQKNYPVLGLSLLFGIFDLNSEFYVTPTSTLFLNGSHGVGVDLGQTGTNGPSVFPNTALAARIRYMLDDNVVFAAAVFDGHPGASDDCNRFDLTVTADDGYFLIGELAYDNGQGGKYGAGVWYFTGSYADVCAVDGLEPYFERRDNAGFYLLFDRKVYAENEDTGEGLSFFSRFGMTNHHVNAVQFHYGGGLLYQGLLDGRDDDVCGYALAAAFFGEDYMALNRFLGNPLASFELSHEVSYKALLSRWFALQPDIQYIIHPSGYPSGRNALVVGLHAEIFF